jgi:hypothetical protein
MNSIFTANIHELAGIVSRAPTATALPTKSFSPLAMDIKINIRDCDLLFVEDPSSKSSLCVPLRLTSLIHIHYDDDGVPQWHVNAQSAQLGCAVMSTSAQVRVRARSLAHSVCRCAS